MKFPFVWRSTYDEACAHARAQTDYRNEMVRQIVEQERSYERLLEKYGSLELRTVDKSLYEDVKRNAEYARQGAQELSRMLTDMTAKYDNLVQLSLERQAPPEPVQQQWEPEKDALEPDVLKAISDRAAPGSPAHTHLIEQVLDLQRRGWDQDDIVDAILKGDEAPV